jgi:ABC-type nitrate/sulfonate/bicarbonate transport system ATPase subunit
MSLPSPVVLEKVSFAYGRIPILQDITFACEHGQTIGLLGGSGSGKTTILNLIAGLIEPDNGSVRVEGRPSWEAVQQKRVGYLFQRPTLYPWLSVLENVALPLVVRHGGMSWINPFRRISRSQTERSMLALRNAKLPGIEDKYPAL